MSSIAQIPGEFQRRDAQSLQDLTRLVANQSERSLHATLLHHLPSFPSSFIIKELRHNPIAQFLTCLRPIFHSHLRSLSFSLSLSLARSLPLSLSISIALACLWQRQAWQTRVGEPGSGSIKGPTLLPQLAHFRTSVVRLLSFYPVINPVVNNLGATITHA